MLYITRWSGEREAPMPMVWRRRGRGIGYADERLYDRDEHGVLWTRTRSEPGKGQPEFGKVHALRHRMAMGGLLCQICAGPADCNAEGVLWLIDADSDDPSLWRGDERTAHPPVCMPCARRSTEACPHLRRAYTAVRVSTFTLWGVRGLLHRPGPTVPEPVDIALLRFGDPRLPWLRASQLVMHLREFTVIDLSAEALSPGRAEQLTGQQQQSPATICSPSRRTR
ncbi:hypothetical protein [Peterkaempfera bronchialis]|uniref:hypothetical protein n=1 Tax=Peterkaempfera bronchialis TaxID=2126346 RepID=UPI00158A995F|nr:hypothetical protein [Peterkaempfera bronchialis]